MPAITASGGRTNARTNSISNDVCMETSGTGARAARCGLRFAGEAASVDAIAQRRPLDLQELGGLRLVAVAHLQRPETEVPLELAQAGVERDRRRRPRRPRRYERRIPGPAFP